jgi:hypothetical protein
LLLKMVKQIYIYIYVYMYGFFLKIYSDS